MALGVGHLHSNLHSRPAHHRDAYQSRGLVMRVIICGGRDFDDHHYIRAKLDAIHAKTPFTLAVTGGAKGADIEAAMWAKLKGIPTAIMPAPWDAHGKAAGAIRNKWMLQFGQPDLVIAFPGGKGTQNMIDQARKAGVEVLPISGTH